MTFPQSKNNYNSMLYSAEHFIFLGRYSNCLICSAPMIDYNTYVGTKKCSVIHHFDCGSNTEIERSYFHLHFPTNDPSLNGLNYQFGLTVSNFSWQGTKREIWGPRDEEPNGVRSIIDSGADPFERWNFADIESIEKEIQLLSLFQ